MHFKLKNDTDKQNIIDYLEKLPDKVYDVDIKVHKENRTVSQNRLYWLYLNCLQAETGNDKDTLHEYFKTQFLPFEEKEIFDAVVPIFPTTTKLDTKQFTGYINKIVVFASSELGIVLPNPEDKHWEEFYSQFVNYI